MILDDLNKQGFTRIQHWKQAILLIIIGLLMGMMYISSNMTGFSAYNSPPIKNYLPNAISMYIAEEEEELDDSILSTEIFNLPEELREEYLKSSKTSHNGIIRSEEELPFQTSCLDSLGKMNYDNITHYDPQDLKSKDVKKILVWHIAYAPQTMHFGIGREGFQRSCCKENRCFITNNRQLMSTTKYDAIIFQFRGLIPEDLPRKRTKRQRWIFFEMESGSYMYENAVIYKNFFNWTMTFRRDSDIFNRYGQILHKPLMPSSKNERVETPAIINYASGKNKLVAWFVSNCETISYRENFVKKLNKYIPIDIFGQCGRLECSRDNENKCFEMLDESYKFYLSFENSLCRDYATEKLFNILKRNVIPVVYGFAYYEDIAPPHSYINALNFNSTRSLANYLLYLDNNDTAYNEYFKWKPHYEVYSGEATRPFNMCELCHKLHNDNKTKVYEDIGDWFKIKSHCKRIIPVSWLEWIFSKAKIRLYPG